MPVRFSGWSPTVLGRVAFSRIGDSPAKGSLVCNVTSADEGLFFGIVRRTSQDGAFPAWVRRLIGQYPDTDYAIFLRVEPAALPQSKNACLVVEGEEEDVVLRDDKRGSLVGEVFFVNGVSLLRGRGQRAAVALLRDQTLRASAPGLPLPNVREAYFTARAEVERAWRAAARSNSKGSDTPAFGRASISLIRTGQITVSVEPHELYTSEAIKLAQQEGEGSPRWARYTHHISDECQSIAEQCFFVLRDLTHQHYHHDKSSDLLTTVTPWSVQDDEEWRRETQYGLMRMAIALRRTDTAQAYREALGVVAYADAFQKHLCGWYSTASGVAVSSAVRFQYDFAALRASIEASLKVRELKDSNLRARLFFAFGTLVTALTILIPAYRGQSPNVDGVVGGQSPVVTVQVAVFGGILKYAIAYPWFTIVAAAVLGLLVDYLFVGLAVKSSNYRKTRASISRAIGGIMAGLRRHKVPDFVNRCLVLLLLSTSLAFLFCVMFFSFKVIYGSIS